MNLGRTISSPHPRHGIDLRGEPLLFTIDEAADRMRLHPETVRRLCRDRKLRCAKMGRLLRISPSAIGELIADAEIPAKVQIRWP